MAVSDSGNHQPRAPVSGQDAKLIFHVKRSDLPENTRDSAIDYRALSPFQQVQKDTVIAEIILAQPGIDGIDENGKAIVAGRGKDVTFTVNEHIEEVSESDRLVYRAAVDGVLTFDRNGAKIVDVLELDCVNSSTGNITTDQNVFVKGDVSMGFHVTCNADLYIKGSVENACFIKCKGDLEVEKGILGERTEVEVNGSANVGYIQNSNLTVDGHLFVKKYIFDSRVVCRGEAVVEGQTVRGKDRGSVVGGCFNSVGSMQLHSVGSEANRTHLICGFDALVYSSEIELEELIVAFNKEVAALERKIGFDIHAEDAAEKAAELDPERKEECRLLLNEMKKTMSFRDEAYGKLKAIGDRADVQDVNSTIKIFHHQRGIVVIELGADINICNESAQTVEYSLVDEKIRVKAVTR